MKKVISAMAIVSLASFSAFAQDIKTAEPVKEVAKEAVPTTTEPVKEAIPTTTQPTTTQTTTNKEGKGSARSAEVNKGQQGDRMRGGQQGERMKEQHREQHQNQNREDRKMDARTKNKESHKKTR